MSQDKMGALTVRARRRVLEELLKRGNSTAYGLAKRLDISDSAVGRHLEVLKEIGLVKPPNVDTSLGRLKKIYEPAEGAEKTLEEFWRNELELAPERIKEKFLK